jgi:cell division protein FtsN
MTSSGRRKRSPQRRTATPGWLWMLFGLGIGLVVAAGIYFSDRRAPAPEASTAALPRQEPTPATPPAARTPAPVAAEAEPTQRFDFYDMLPQFEVVVPESEQGIRPIRQGSAIQEAGSYVLQTGSFSSAADADRMQASLALLGIESRVQRVQIDDDTYHRVRIGPLNDLDELNRIRRRLWDANIEAMLLRVTN